MPLNVVTRPKTRALTAARLARFPMLPAEVHREILLRLSECDGSTVTLTDEANALRRANRFLSVSARVSKTWKELVYPILYQDILLISDAHLAKFVQTILKDPSLRVLVRSFLPCFWGSRTIVGPDFFTGMPRLERLSLRNDMQQMETKFALDFHDERFAEEEEDEEKSAAALAAAEQVRVAAEGAGSGKAGGRGGGELQGGKQDKGKGKAGVGAGSATGTKGKGAKGKGKARASMSDDPDDWIASPFSSSFVVPKAGTPCPQQSALPASSYFTSVTSVERNKLSFLDITTYALCRFHLTFDLSALHTLSIHFNYALATSAMAIQLPALRTLHIFNLVATDHDAQLAALLAHHGHALTHLLVSGRFKLQEGDEDRVRSTCPVLERLTLVDVGKTHARRLLLSGHPTLEVLDFRYSSKVFETPFKRGIAALVDIDALYPRLRSVRFEGDDKEWCFRSAADGVREELMGLKELELPLETHTLEDEDASFDMSIGGP